MEQSVKGDGSPDALKGDHQSIRAVLEAAFPTAAESKLVDALRESDALWVSLLAETDTGEVVGHIAFSPVTLDFRNAPDDSSNTRHAAAIGAGVGLGPVAVRPDWQRRGVGTALVRQGLERCRALEKQPVFCVVLGDPHFYARFGFRAAHLFGLTSDYDNHCTPASASDDPHSPLYKPKHTDPAEAPFMALEFVSGALSNLRAHANYHEVFKLL